MRALGTRACALLALLLGSAGAFAQEMAALDLRIVDAQIIDGTGAEPYVGEVHVRGDRIVHLGPLTGAEPEAGRVVDAGGRVVSPGFVDPHSHGDPLQTPNFENFLAMGVTTITLGQDGSSPDVDDLADWLPLVEAEPMVPNLAMFVGHGTLRRRSGIGRAEVPDEASLARLDALLDRNLDVAFGLSSGLEYVPGLHAKVSELERLAQTVGRRDRVIMSHMRNEDDPALEASLAELIAQGRHARVHAAHLKSVYGRGSARGKALLEVLEDARADGVRISADVYPYTASYTGLALLFPVWSKTREQFDVVRLTRRPELVTHLHARVAGRNGPEATLLAAAPYTGMTLADLAERLEKPYAEVLIDDLGPDGGSAAYFIMDEDLQEEFIADESIAISSDGSPTGFHPRGHGTFARIIETFVRERGRLTLPAAIRKMTSLPASIIGLEDRGELRVGAFADLVVFDPAQVRERATYVAPMTLAEGFDLVVVNGEVVRENGALTGMAPGRVLRP